ncbi:MAG TPA: BrnA antitoxin family protein [Stellaceae bacterium]|jgi:uncharacterized protein (DUF4415 family)|nr:BrnA antitoxin family protein [Stellaceae bacterium]
MRGSKSDLGSDLAKVDAMTDEEIAQQIAEDPDAAPELTDDQLEEAELFEGDRFVRRVGRPKGSGTKELVTLRIDRDVLDRFRADGPGWQTRLNDVLRAASAPRPAKRRRGRSLSGTDAVLEAVRALPDGATPAEIRAYLRREYGMAVSPGRVSMVLRHGARGSTRVGGKTSVAGAKPH